MAESELRCDACQVGVGSCVETLTCGHYYCHGCACRKEKLNVTCLLCELPETEHCDILSCNKDLPIEKDIPVIFKTGMSVNNNTELNKQHPASESTNLQQVIDVDEMQDDLGIKIDDALVIADNHASQLNHALQILENVKFRNMVYEENVSQQIDKEFERFSTALKERKSYLFAEVRKAFDALNADLDKAARNLQEQKKDLDARVLFARGLKASPELTVYCDLNQLVADLMLDCKHEHLIESVNKHPNIRFSINDEIIIQLIEAFGNISNDVNSQVMPDGSSMLPTKRESNPLDAEPMNENCATDVTETTCSMDIQTDLVEVVNSEHNTKPDNKPCLNSVDSGHQAASMLSMLSAPDVLIEEIIEEAIDDQDFPNTEPYSCKAKKIKKSQKKMVSSPPFLKKKRDQAYAELVYLSYIINPCNFYVHRISQKKQLIMLERSLATLCKSQSHCSPCDVLELGEIIALYSSKRNAWCRGKITELVPLESKYVQKPCGPTRYRFEDLLCITAFLLDYGTSEMFIVTSFIGACLKKDDHAATFQTRVNDLCHIFTKLDSFEDQKLRKMDPFAVHCSLDIVPQTPDGSWTKEVRNHILKVINNKSVQMKVLREENKMLIVDLKKPVSMKMSSDMPASLRDALVFSFMAKFPSYVSGLQESTAAARYKDPCFPNNTTETVIVCHMNDPSDFYIHVICEPEYIKVVKKIQEIYNQEESDGWKIVYPAIGQACVAKYETNDDHWYRAEIIGIPSHEEVDIKFVDFGNVSRVNVTKLRMLKEELLELPRKAISCRLAYIQPSCDATQWSPLACKLFEELTSCKHLRCNAIGMFLESKLSVELFDVNPASVMSINSILVKSNVATFIPGASGFGDPHLPLKEVWDTFLDQPVDSLEKCIDTISLSERKDLDVYISHVVSPSKIFVQWLSSENILKSLETSMFEMYENSKPDCTELQVDMFVAVWLSVDKVWRRGKIKNIISQQLVEVFCYDFGTEELTNVTNLRTLDDNLKKYGTMCLECTLMDIQPAGGCKNWTATACDFISYYLNGAAAKMIIEENASMWPLPVRILCMNEAGQLVDVSDFLVKKGLALRDRRLKKYDSLTEVHKAESTSTRTHQSVKEADVEPSNSKLDGENCITTEEHFTVSDKSAVDVKTEDPYLPPLIPDEKTFIAKVSHVAEDGTIYVIQDCLDNELGALMLDIQNSFKCLGLMTPYHWKKGEGCLIKGSDTMSYRGRILEILGGDMIKVQYEDFGFTEKIPKCHLYPSVYNPGVPRFCIPCQLIDVLPVGDHWQPDAIQFLKELLLDRLVKIHLVESPKFCGDAASIYLYCGNASMSAILEQYTYCIPKDCERKTKVEIQSFSEISYEKSWSIDFQELLCSDWDTPVISKYLPLALPSSTEVFKVKVTHLETPNRVFVSIDNKREKSQINNDCEIECDPVHCKLMQVNEDTNILPCLTDFRTEMPCLATYSDNRLHRAKLVAVQKYDPVSFIVEFVDYGSTAVLETSSLFQLPPCLIQYPVKAIKVKLAGFRPPKKDLEKERLPYKQQWSLKAMYAMMDIVQRKHLFAKSLPSAAENTVCLFDEQLKPIHEPLLRMGLADPE